MLPIHTILHPTDFSEQSEAAFRFAAALARDYGARLVLTHILSTPVVMYAEGIVVPLPDDCREELRDKLRELAGRVAPNVPVEIHLDDGDPASEILDRADNQECDLIVMGTHGLSGLRRILMGSVAEQVSRKATCPVLTLKVPYPEAVRVAANVLAAAGG